MNYLNLNTNLCSNMEFGDCHPDQRGVWLSVMLYCAKEENSGVILGAKNLSNRAWIMGCGITKEEALKENPLIEWKGDDLHLKLYPIEQEEVMRKKREFGKRGGRPKINHDDSENKPCGLTKNNHMVSDAENVIVIEKERKGNSKGSAEGGLPPKPRVGSLKRPTVDELVTAIPDNTNDLLSLSIAQWAEHKQSLPARNQVQSIKSWLMMIKRMEKFDTSVVIDSIERAISNGWVGWDNDLKTDSGKAILKDHRPPEEKWKEWLGSFQRIHMMRYPHLNEVPEELKGFWDSKLEEF